jgi:hypothetical protein
MSCSVFYTELVVLCVTSLVRQLMPSEQSFSGPAAVFIFGSERTASSSAAHEFKLCRELRKFEAVCAAAGPEVL